MNYCIYTGSALTGEGVMVLVELKLAHSCGAFVTVPPSDSRMHTVQWARELNDPSLLHCVLFSYLITFSFVFILFPQFFKCS